ncbi:MAG: outer membrane protein assembly factor BamE [Pseudomonadota bacterium]
MHKLLIFSLVAASVISTGCSRSIKSTEPGKAPFANMFNNWSLVHKQTIQQGNVLTREMLESIEPGMSKEQVRFTLGTPPLVDVFHQDRWDYLFWEKRRNRAPESKRLTLFFEDGLLVRTEGEYEPGIPDETENVEEVIVSVPDYEAPRKSIVTKTLETVGIKEEEE